MRIFDLVFHLGLEATCPIGECYLEVDKVAFFSLHTFLLIAFRGFVIFALFGIVLRVLLGGFARTLSIRFIFTFGLLFGLRFGFTLASH